MISYRKQLLNFTVVGVKAKNLSEKNIAFDTVTNSIDSLVHTINNYAILLTIPHE